MKRAASAGRLVAEAAARLGRAAGGAARLEAEVLLAHSVGARREWILAHPEAPVASAAARGFRRAVARRAASGVPVAYLTGVREWAGLSFSMRPGVFIPRPETEGLLERVEGWVRMRGNLSDSSAVVDACTGSGAIAVALARHSGVRVIATDVSARALALARLNARRLGAGSLVRCVRGDGLAAVSPGIRVAAVVSNPPYVRDGEWRRLPRDIRDHEPRAALTAGPDGLAVIRRLADQAAARLPAGGLIALEIGASQRAAVLELLGGGGWEGARVEKDLAGRWRYALAVRKAGHSGALGTVSGPPLRGSRHVDRVRL